MSSSNFVKIPTALVCVFGQLLILGCHEILCSEFTKESLEKNAPTSRRANENARISLAFVFDRTGSMYDDLIQVRAGAAQILNTTIEDGENAVKNYILVPFRDPDVGPAFQTEDPRKFLKALNEIYVRGGKDCPEMSITAIKQALQLSLPGSVVYVFTDAEAKDHRVLPDVIQLIREKEIRVNFVLTGTCGLKPYESPVDTYETIATTSSGQIVNLNKSEVNKIWKFVELSISSKRKSIFSGDKLTRGKFTYVVVVQPLLDQIIATASGENVQLTIRDGEGRLVYPGDNGVEELFRVRSSVSVLIRNPEAGNWSFTVDSDDRQMLRVEGISRQWRKVRGKHTVVVISETDECEVGIHNCKADEICANIPNGFRCEKKCARGFQKTTQGDCIDINECSQSIQRRTQVCRRGRTCVNTFGSYRCESNCPSGFKRRGAHDCEDINECLENSQVCGRHACANTRGSYRCEIKCQEGFKRDQDGVCADIDECSQNSHVCGDRECINTRGSHHCEIKCQKGFRRGRDAVCIDINECLERSGLCQHTCKNTAGSFQCLCPRGTRLDTDNFTCLRIKTCPIHSRGRCQYRCNDDTGRCECPRGYRLHWNEISCIDINECLTGEHVCGGRECFNTLGKYHCLNVSCPQGYFLNRDRYCTKQCSHYTDQCPGQYSIVRHCAVSIPCYLPPNTDFLYLEPYIPQTTNIYRSLVCYCSVYFYPVQGKQHLFGVYQAGDVGALYNRMVFDKPGFYEFQVVSDYLNGYGNVISRTTFHVFLDVSDHPF